MPVRGAAATVLLLLWSLVASAAEQARQFEPAGVCASEPLAQDVQASGSCLLQVDVARRPAATAARAATSQHADETEKAAPGATSMSALYAVGPIRPVGGLQRTASDEVDLLQLLGLSGGNATVSAELPEKSKVVLMILEMVPLLGPLGVDRFYLGATTSGIAKLLVCVCTLGLGGMVWGLIDCWIVIVNGIASKQTIDTLGLRAQFTENDIQIAQKLALIGVVINMFTLWAGTRFNIFIRMRYFPSGTNPGAAATLEGAAGARASPREAPSK